MIFNRNRQIFYKTNNLHEIYESGQILGRTEGAVYGMAINNAPRWMTLMDNRSLQNSMGTVIFEAQASSLFKLHPVEGPYSGCKRILRQYKAPFGDIIFDRDTCCFDEKTNTIIIRSAWIEKHCGKLKVTANVQLFGRRMLDVFMTLLPLLSFL